MAKSNEQPISTITIPGIEVGKLEIHIRGTSPLLVNRFSEETQKTIEGKQQGEAKLKKAPRKPVNEFNAARHKMSNGKDGFPAAGIKASLVASGGRYADEKMTILRGVVTIPVRLIEIVGPAPIMQSDMVKPKAMGGNCSMAYRAAYQTWEMKIPVLFMSNMIKPDQIANLFNIAGFSVGIGAWRPEKNGQFGTFEVVGIKSSTGKAAA